MVANSRETVSRILGFPKNRMSPEVAKKVRSWKFSPRDRSRVSDLLEKNRLATITRSELSELNMLVALGDLLDLLHVEADLAIKKVKKIPSVR